VSREQIAESEEKYRALVEHSEDGVFVAQDKKIIFVNTVFSRCLGYALDEICGQPLARFIAPEDRELVLSRHTRRLTGKHPPDCYECALLYSDGSTRIPGRLRVGTGKIRGDAVTIGTFHDMTVERQQEAALAESLELHRKMNAAIPDVIVQVNLDGTIVYINEKGVALAGCTHHGELTGTSIFPLFAPESLPSLQENLQLMFERPLGPREYQFITRDQRRVQLEVNGDVLRMPDGTPTGMIFICRDITSRRAAEQELRRSEEDYRRIIGNMQEMFYRTDVDGVITMISTYGARLLGFDAEEEVTGTCRMTDFYADPKEREHFLACLTRERNVSGYPITLKDRHGRLHAVLASSRLIADEGGRFCGVEGIIHDVTRIREVEKALRQANRQITLMTSITRHDIHNQLFALTGYLDLSMHAVADPDLMADLIRKEQKIADNIGQQMSFTRFFDDMGAKPPSWQDPAALIETTRAALVFDNVRLDVSLPAVEVFADLLFVKVFYNLFDNALQYGGNAMTGIRVSAQRDGTDFLIVVEDDGVGIPEGNKARIFERGFGHHTGLGLFLAGEILAISGMTIRESGVPGTGARFEIRVPDGNFRYAGKGEPPR
jgi:PAS domain S-box-containing protein